MANNASKLSALDAEKADRAAASIRPSWAFDEADFEAPAKPDAFEDKLSTKDAKPVALAKEAPFAGSAPPHDTIIDGMPTVTVGRTIDIGPAPEDAKPAKADRAPPPPRPQATRFGLGDDAPTTSNGTQIIPATSGAAAAAAAAIASASERPADAGAAFAPGEVAEVAPLEAPRAVSASAPPVAPSTPPEARASARPAPMESVPPPAPVAPVAPSISRIEDPIEIPRKSMGPLVWLIGGAVAIGAIVGGIVLATSGGDKPAGEPTASTQTTAKATPTPTEKPATATAATPPTTPATPTTAAASATPTAEPSVTSSAAATPTETPTTAPTTKPSSKPTTTPAAGTPKPPATTPKQPPPKGSGGIRRDTPF